MTSLTPFSFLHTQDVQCEANSSFSQLGIQIPIIRGLQTSGFIIPSPVQQSVIPFARSNPRFCVQAKSGTGKTLAFSIIALENLELTRLYSNRYIHQYPKPQPVIPKKGAPQCLFIVPTREIGYQIQDTLENIGQFLSPIDSLLAPEQLISKNQKSQKDNLLTLRPLSVYSCFGNNATNESIFFLKNKKVDICIGTLGRLSHLIRIKALSLDNLDTIIIDEIDYFIQDKQFKHRLSIILQSSAIYQPKFYGFSATLSDSSKSILKSLVKSIYNSDLKFLHIDINALNESLKGIFQAFTDYSSPLGPTPNFSLETVSDGTPMKFLSPKLMFRIVKCLNHISFNQCIIFHSSPSVAESISQSLAFHFGKQCLLFQPEVGFRFQENKFLPVQCISRKDLVKFIRMKTIKIIVATNIIARGVDFESIDLVLHADPPSDMSIYSHRVGRAGRYGRKGTSVLLVDNPSSIVPFVEKGYPIVPLQWPIDVNVQTKFNKIMSKKSLIEYGPLDSLGRESVHYPSKLLEPTSHSYDHPPLVVEKTASMPIRGTYILQKAPLKKSNPNAFLTRSELLQFAALHSQEEPDPPSPKTSPKNTTLSNSPLPRVNSSPTFLSQSTKHNLPPSNTSAKKTCSLPKIHINSLNSSLFPEILGFSINYNTR